MMQRGRRPSVPAESATSASFHLITLGRHELLDSNGLPVTSLLCQPRRLALLFFLAAAEGGFHSRLSVARIFWPHASSFHARGALKQAVFAIRKGLGTDVFLTRASFEIGIDRRLLRCDAFEFRQAVAQGRIPEALSLYRGPFLSGFEADVGVEFEAWLSAERHALSRLHQACLCREGA